MIVQLATKPKSRNYKDHTTKLSGVAWQAIKDWVTLLPVAMKNQPYARILSQHWQILVDIATHLKQELGGLVWSGKKTPAHCLEGRVPVGNATTDDHTQKPRRLHLK